VVFESAGGRNPGTDGTGPCRCRQSSAGHWTPVNSMHDSFIDSQKRGYDDDDDGAIITCAQKLAVKYRTTKKRRRKNI